MTTLYERIRDIAEFKNLTEWDRIMETSKMLQEMQIKIDNLESRVWVLENPNAGMYGGY